MPFDPGTNSWGFSWGNSGSWGGGAPNGSFGGGGVRGLPRRPLITSYQGGPEGLGQMPGPALNQAMDWQRHDAMSQQQNEALFSQQLQERMLGLQSRYDMERLNAQLQAQQNMAMMQMFAQGMALPSAEQIERSRGDLQTSLGDFARMRDNGRYSQGEMDTLSQDAWNKINQGSMQQAQDMNQQMASRGMFGSPGAAAALRMAGQFGANAQRGAVQANLLRENKEAQERGTMGYADISRQLADFASRPINRMANFNPFTGEGMPPGWGPTDPNKKKQPQPMAYGNNTPWQPRVAGGY